MKILVIADQKPYNLIEVLEKNKIDLIITLGDLNFLDLRELMNIDIKKIGVHGNHCYGEYMEDLDIIDLHLKTIEINGLLFGGFEGCVRYKEVGKYQYTQEETNELIKKLPKVDVLITHCPPKGINDNEDNAHIGFIALKKYIDENNPKYFFHGHTYDNGKFISKYKNTNIIYVDGMKILDL